MKKILPISITCFVFLCIVIVKCFPFASFSPQTASAQTADTNFKVAFIGDSAAHSDFQNVLNLIKSENAQMVLHQGDLDYSDGPQKWMDMVNTTLGANFPYLASDGNHDEWDADGYAAFFKDRLTKLGITAPSGSLSSSYSVVYHGLKIVFSKENGDPTFIDSELKNATQGWKICSWHKNQQLMQIGGKTDEQGWPDYETCRKYGAIIATGHEHSYERTKTLTNTQTQTVDTSCPDPKSLCVAPGKTFVFVSGLGGNSIRNQDLCLPTTPPYGCKGEWASIYTADQNAQFGALFIIFNYNGNPNKAHAYFKNVSGKIVDEFDITNSSSGVQPTSIVPTKPGITLGPSTPGSNALPPGTTGVLLDVLLHGIGKGGDNQNVNGGNLSPLHTSRTVTVTLTDKNNIDQSPTQGTITYNATSGSFQGQVAVGTNIASGPYLVKIKLDNYLAKQYSGIITFTKGTITTLPSIRLVAGDSNNDNLLSVLDYNLILDCFSDLTPARNCSDAAKKQAADLTDDGAVNQFDYNLFLRELSVQAGADAGIPNNTVASSSISPPPTATLQPTLSTTVTSNSVSAKPSSYSCAKTIAPGADIATALSSTSGVLCLSSGTYNVGHLTLNKSGATLAAASGQRPILSGQVIIAGANMTLDGINVTWNSALSSSDHMVKVTGSGITIKNGEIWGAHSYAGMLISGGATNFLIQNMYIHDTYKSNSTNQDHLIYVDNASNGVIERNLFVNSPNGRGVKLGPPSGSGGPHDVIIRYNTFYNNLGPSNIQLSYGTKNVTIMRNILVKSSDGNITGYNLSGSGNKASDNIGWDSAGVITGGGITDGGGNQHVDPQLNIGGDYKPKSTQATAYGRYAP